MMPERDTHTLTHSHANTHTHIGVSRYTYERERGTGAVTDVERGADREQCQVHREAEDTYIVVGMRSDVEVAMRTHVERGADSEACQGKTSRLSHCRCKRLYFSLSACRSQTSSKCNTSRTQFFLGGGIVLVTVFGDTHLPYDGVQPTAEKRFHLCIVVFIHSRSYEHRYRSRCEDTFV